MARDFNDIKDYCYSLFSSLKSKYPTTFKGDPEEFNMLNKAISGLEKQHGAECYVNNTLRFKEWNDLIDLIRKQTK